MLSVRAWREECCSQVKPVALVADPDPAQGAWILRQCTGNRCCMGVTAPGDRASSVTRSSASLDELGRGSGGSAAQSARRRFHRRGRVASRARSHRPLVGRTVFEHRLIGRGSRKQEAGLGRFYACRSRWHERVRSAAATGFHGHPAPPVTSATRRRARVPAGAAPAGG